MILVKAKTILARIVKYDYKVNFKFKCNFTIINYDLEIFIVLATDYLP
jgi:hypothetical protein